MKKTKLIAVSLIIGLGIFLIAADHIDAPAVAGTSADLTDFMPLKVQIQIIPYWWQTFKDLLIKMLS